MGILPALVAQERTRAVQEEQGLNRILGVLQGMRFEDLGRKFFRSYDPSPEGLQRFAAENRLSLPELSEFMALVKGFEDFRTGRLDAHTAYLKARTALEKALAPQPFTLSPGQTRYENGKPVASVPATGFTLSPGAARYDNQGRIVAQRPAEQKPFTLSPGAARYDAQGRLVVQRAPAPSGFTLGPGQTRYEGGKPVASKPAKKESGQKENPRLKALRSLAGTFLGRYSSLMAKQNIYTENDPQSEQVARQNLAAAIGIARQIKKEGGDPRDVGITPDFLGKLLQAGAITREEADRVAADLFPELE